MQDVLHIMMTYSQFKALAGYFFNFAHWVLSLMPSMWLILLYTYVVRARFILGYWPRPYNPDPKSQMLTNSLGFHYELTWIIGLAGFYSILAFLLLVPVCKFLDNKSRVGLRSFLCGLFFTASFALMRYDPGRFIEWFFD